MLINGDRLIRDPSAPGLLKSHKLLFPHQPPPDYLSEQQEWNHVLVTALLEVNSPKPPQMDAQDSLTHIYPQQDPTSPSSSSWVDPKLPEEELKGRTIPQDAAMSSTPRG